MNAQLIPYLRLAHIVAGTFWVGATMLMAFFVYPAVKKSGEAGSTFIKGMVQTNNLPLWMNVSSLLTILTGLGLMAIISNGFSPVFFSASYGLFLAVGAGFAVTAFLHGFFKIRPCGMRLAAIGKELGAGRMSMTDELKNETRLLNQKIISATGIEVWLLITALVLMIFAKYI